MEGSEVMNSLNEVTLLGLVTNDLKSIKSDKGTQIVTFQIHTKEEYKNRETQEVHEHNEWHDVKAYGYMAEKCSSAIKNGSRVLVRGHNRRESWTDKSEQKKYRTYVLVDDLMVLDQTQVIEKAATLS